MDGLDGFPDLFRQIPRGGKADAGRVKPKGAALVRLQEQEVRFELSSERLAKREIIGGFEDVGPSPVPSQRGEFQQERARLSGDGGVVPRR